MLDLLTAVNQFQKKLIEIASSNLDVKAYLSTVHGGIEARLKGLQAFFFMMDGHMTQYFSERVFDEVVFRSIHLSHYKLYSDSSKREIRRLETEFNY